MGLFTFLNRGTSSGSSGGSSFGSGPSGVNLSGLGGGGAASSSQDQGLPDRFDLNKTFNDWSGSTAGIFGELGKAPAKFAETPFSFGHQLVTRAASFIPGGSDALQAAGSAVAPVAGFAGDVMNRVSNFVPALINSEDANLFKAIGDLPGNTPLSPEVLLQHGIAPKIENTGGWWGLGALGITGHVKTVDEFKSELMKRGFFSDATGQSIDPNGLLQQLRGGRSVYDFGSKAINDNPLVDMAGRLATDPSNALFLIPGAGLVKGAALATKGAEAAKMGAEGGNIGMRVLEMVGRVVPRSRLIEAGAIAPKLPSPIIAAEALARGLTSMGTLKGAGLFLKEGATSGSRLGLSVLRTATDVPGYLRAAEGATGLAKTVSRARSFTRASTALGATNLAFNRLSNTANNLLGGNVPILKDIAQFSADVENDRPLSNNSAWMLASAIAFPYGEVAGEIKAKVGAEKVRALGRNAYDPLVRLAGSHEKLLTGVGGPDALRGLADFADKQHMKQLYGDKPIQNMAGAQSNPDLAVRTDITGKVLQDLVNRARENGTVNGNTRATALQDWALQQGGFADKPIDYRPTFQDIMERWKQYMPVQHLNDQLMNQAGLIVGLTDVLHTEHIDAVHTMLKAAVGPGDTVPKKAIMSAVGDFPQINMKDTKGYWAKLALPDVPDPTWNSVRAKLNAQRADAVPIKEYYADAIANEKAAAADIPPPDTSVQSSQKIDQLRADAATTVDANGTILPDQVDRAHAIQKNLEDQLAKLNNVEWIDRGQKEKAAGLDPALSRSMQDEASKAIGVDVPATLDAAGPTFQAQMDNLSYKVAQVNPTYAAKRAPTDALIAQLRPDDPQFLAAVQGHTALGDWLATDGPLAPVGRFMDALFSPVRQHEMSRLGRQELYNQFISRSTKGAKVEAKDIDAWLGKLEDRVKATTFTLLHNTVQAFRGIHSVPAGMLVDDFKAVPALAKMGLKDAEIVKLFDRAGSRYERANLQGIREGNKLSAILDRVYRADQGIPGVSATQRLVGRTFYPIFRFLADPRWWAMNSVEASILASKDGILRVPKGGFDPLQQHFAGAPIGTDMAIQPDASFMFGQHYTQIAAAVLKKRSVASAEATLNAIGDQADEFVMLRQVVKREADANLASGLIDQKQHAEQMKFATRDMAQHINDFLYRVDKRGVNGAVKKTVDEQIKMHLTAEEAKVMQPLLQQVVERNVQIWTDVKHMLIGKSDRSNVERIANSYWLYWPIGYQIKATKWLANIMLDGSFGHDNGALLAGKYALWQQQHQQQMTTNPQYAAMFNQNKTLWFMAEMLMPITPDSIGVSLSRPTRFVAEAIQSQVNKLLPQDSRIKAFTAYKQTQGGVLPALTWFGTLGPIYTYGLLNRAANEPMLKNSFLGQQQPNQPADATAPAFPTSAPPTLPYPAGSPTIP